MRLAFRFRLPLGVEPGVHLVADAAQQFAEHRPAPRFQVVPGGRAPLGDRGGAHAEGRCGLAPGEAGVEQVGDLPLGVGAVGEQGAKQLEDDLGRLEGERRDVDVRPLAHFDFPAYLRPFDGLAGGDEGRAPRLAHIPAHRLDRADSQADVPVTRCESGSNGGDDAGGVVEQALNLVPHGPVESGNRRIVGAGLHKQFEQFGHAVARRPRGPLVDRHRKHVPSFSPRPVPLSQRAEPAVLRPDY